MKLVEKYIVENYGRRNSSKLMINEGIPKLFMKIESVKKQIDKLTDERKQKFSGAYAKKINAETDNKKREQLKQPIIVISQKISNLQKNLSDLYDLEEKYVTNLGKDDELELSEDTDLGHEDDEPGMLRADLSVIERCADELGEMMATFEASGEEIDFPHWWQSKIINAKADLTSATEYLKSQLEK
jgi:hypothetical protein